MFPALLVAALSMLSIPINSAAEDPTSAYETAVSADGPVCWWRMAREDGDAVINHCARAAELAAQPVGKVALDVAGPRGDQFPDFADGNVAVRLPAGKNYLRVTDPGDASLLDFDNGDAITIEAWIQPAAKPNPTYSYIVGKGRTSGSRNQNYALRLYNRGRSGHLSFFFVDAETPDASASHNADGHRWTSRRAVPHDGRWHHVALVYEFGNPESIRGYVDGAETKGKWELGGSTSKRPVVDNDELWIGSSLSGRATFPGAIDEVALYRKTLPPEAIKRHARIQRRDEILAMVADAAERATADRVQYELSEAVPVGTDWDFAPTQRRPLYESDVMALTELPRKYDRRGVIVDRVGPVLIHVFVRVALPPGRHKLLLRSLNGARLYVDDRLLSENPFLKIAGNGHGKLYKLDEPSPDRLSLPAAHHENIVDYNSDGTPRVFSLVAVAGLSGRPLELGEVVVACKSDGPTFELLAAQSDVGSPGESISYRTLDDAGWCAFLEHDRSNRRAWQARTRRQLGGEEASFWKKRHAEVRRILADTPRTKIPNVAHEEHVNNAVDRFIQHRLEAEDVEPLPPADDLAFLRRLSLDVMGVIPAPRQIETFLADPPPERRARAVDRLLADPGWADHWVGYWQHVLAENPGLTKPSLNNSGPFRWFVHESFLDNKPLDRFVTELITMQGGSSSGGPAGFAKATNNDVPMAHKAHVIGTAFLGVQMKCARCHDAPFHESTQRDLFSLAAMLAGKPLAVPGSSSVPATPEQLARMAVTVTLKPGAQVKPAWSLEELGVAPADVSPDWVRSGDSRARLAAMIAHPANRRFARVFVNRLWKRYLGRGLVEPVHDWEGAEPSHPALLDYLAEELAQSGYDIKHVARLILTSQAYGRQLAGGKSDDARSALFAAATRRRMTAEQLADSVFAAVGKPFDSEQLCMNPDGRQPAKNFPDLGTPRRAWEFVCTSNERERPSMTLPRAQSMVDLLMAFGWTQSRQEPINERETELTPLVPLALANGEAVARAIDLADHGALVPLCLEDQSVEQLVDRLVLRLLGRQATPSERERYANLLGAGFADRRTGRPPHVRRVDRSPLSWSNNLDAAANKVGIERQHRASQGDLPTRQLTEAWRERAEDMVWAIVNSPEFVFLP